MVCFCVSFLLSFLAWFFMLTELWFVVIAVIVVVVIIIVIVVIN